MGLGRYLVEAVVVEGRSITELARSHGVRGFTWTGSNSWLPPHSADMWTGK